jgi:hypothetical protein
MGEIKRLRLKGRILVVLENGLKRGQEDTLGTFKVDKVEWEYYYYGDKSGLTRDWNERRSKVRYGRAR